MIPQATLRAITDMLSPGFRRILLKALGITILLFAAVMLAVQGMLTIFARLPWDWLNTAMAWLAGIGLFAAFLLFMAPVTALFAGLFLDEVADLVERQDYPADPPGKAADLLTSLGMGVEAFILMIGVFLLVLPLWFLAIGPAVMVAVNAWLLSREFFVMAAMRHMPPTQARRLRKMHAIRLWLAGLVPALLAHVPVINLFVPLFATAYFVHVYKTVAGRGRATPR